MADRANGLAVTAKDLWRWVAEQVASKKYLKRELKDLSAQLVVARESLGREDFRGHPKKSTKLDQSLANLQCTLRESLAQCEKIARGLPGFLGFAKHADIMRKIESIRRNVDHAYTHFLVANGVGTILDIANMRATFAELHNPSDKGLGDRMNLGKVGVSKYLHDSGTTRARDLTGAVTTTEPRPFASGGFADVWRADFSDGDGRCCKVVIKKWRSSSVDSGSSEPAQRRLEREARVWALLSPGPNIVPLLGVCYDDELPNFVAPYYKNGNIKDYLKNNPGGDRLQLLSHVSAALVYLHTLEPPVIHGDIKSLNILIDDNGKARLTDFGISRILRTSGFTTQFNNNAGSARWMATELFLVDEPGTPADGEESLETRISEASDIWSFGMTILEVFTGVVPFSILRSDAQVISHLLFNKRPQRPQGIPLLNDALWALLERCWANDPPERPSADKVHFIITGIRLLPDAFTREAVTKLLASS